VAPILIVASLTLLASFLCSLFEAALYSITPARVEVLRERGARNSEQLAAMKANVEEPIAAILTVNTIAHTVGAAWCGAMVGSIYGSQAVGIFAAAFTVLVLAFTEIVPKSYGARYAAVLGPWIVWPIRVMIWSVWPVVWVANKAMRALTDPESLKGPSEDEVLGIASLAARGGSVRPEEHRWVQNALRLDLVSAGDLRTPRTVVETISAQTPVAEVIQDIGSWVHSRVPVIEGSDSDRILGLVHRREVVDAALERPDENLVIQDLVHEMPRVPESMPAHRLLNLFLDERRHMVAVVDEYGGFEGVVTLEDVMECLLGREIVDEYDEFEDMQAEARVRGQRTAEPDTSENDPG